MKEPFETMRGEPFDSEQSMIITNVAIVFGTIAVIALGLIIGCVVYYSIKVTAGC